MAAGSAAVLSALILNAIIGACCFALFSVLRLLKWARKFFGPRRYARDLPLHPRRLPDTLWGWVVPCLTYPEEDVIDEAGLDAAMYLRILKFGVLLFCGLTLWCVAAVLPANLTSRDIDRLLREQDTASNGTSSSPNDYRFTDFDRFSLSNVEAGSRKLWVHLVSLHVVSIYTLWLLQRFNRQSVLLRLQFLGNAQRGGPSHTVLVTDIPGVSPDLIQAVTSGLRREVSRLVRVVHSGAKSVPGSRPASAVSSATAPTGSTLLQPSGTGHTGPSAELVRRGSSRFSVKYPAQPSQQPPQPLPPTVGEGEGQGAVASRGLSEEWYRRGGGEVRRPGPVAEGAEGRTSEEPLLPGEHAPDNSLGGPGTTPGNGHGVGGVAGMVEEGQGQQQQQQQQQEQHWWPSAPPSRRVTEDGRSTVYPEDPRVSFKERHHQHQHQHQQHLTHQHPHPHPHTQTARARLSFGSRRQVVPAPDPDPGPDPGSGHDADQEATTLPDGHQGQHPQGYLQHRPQAVKDVQPGSGDPGRPPKRFRYSPYDASLDPTALAQRKLQSGVTPEDLVRQEFELVYRPEQLAAVHMVRDTRRLEPLVAEYDKLVNALEDHMDEARLHLRLRKRMKRKKKTVLGVLYGAWGAEYLGTRGFKRVDEVDFWIARLKFLKVRIQEEQARALTRAEPSAFVTFNTRTSQSVSSCSLHANDVDTWVVEGAPAPFELLWANLRMTGRERRRRGLVLWAAFAAMTLFFMIPVAAVQALIEVPKLATVPVLQDIVRAPAIRQILEAVIPGLALKVFLLLVPWVLRLMVTWSGAVSLSGVDFGVTRRFFLFQVVVVFFGNVVAGSFFNQLRQWIDAPETIVPILGKAIPMTATFFITYLITTGLGVQPVAFLRLPSFALYWLLKRMAGSPRARERLWSQQYTDNGTTVADHTIAILLGLVFSCMNPLVCPAALAYFLVTALGERYNHIYVFRRRYESAGRLWGTVYNQVMAGLYVAQLTLLGVLGLKRFVFAPLGVPLLLATAAQHANTLRRYRRPWTVTSLHDAAELDAAEAQDAAGAAAAAVGSASAPPPAAPGAGAAAPEVRHVQHQGTNSKAGAPSAVWDPEGGPAPGAHSSHPPNQAAPPGALAAASAVLAAPQPPGAAVHTGPPSGPQARASLLPPLKPRSDAVPPAAGDAGRGAPGETMDDFYWRVSASGASGLALPSRRASATAGGGATDGGAGSAPPSWRGAHNTHTHGGSNTPPRPPLGPGPRRGSRTGSVAADARAAEPAAGSEGGGGGGGGEGVNPEYSAAGVGKVAHEEQQEAVVRDGGWGVDAAGVVGTGGLVPLTEEEAAEVGRLYQDPCFKVPLEHLPSLEAQALDMWRRLGLLHDWLDRMAAAGKKPPQPPSAAARQGKRRRTAAGASAAAAAGSSASSSLSSTAPHWREAAVEAGGQHDEQQGSRGRRQQEEGRVQVQEAGDVEVAGGRKGQGRPAAGSGRAGGEGEDDDLAVPYEVTVYDDAASDLGAGEGADMEEDEEERDALLQQGQQQGVQARQQQQV